MNTEEKSLKAAIKKETRLLEVKTKDTIEGLSDTQVIELLKAKWIQPLIQSLMKLPDRIVNELVSKLETLAKKYETTFAEVETEIADTQAALSAMIDELEGAILICWDFKNSKNAWRFCKMTKKSKHSGIKIQRVYIHLGTA